MSKTKCPKCKSQKVVFKGGTLKCNKCGYINSFNMKPKMKIYSKEVKQRNQEQRRFLNG